MPKTTRILVIDDDRDTRELTMDILSGEGYTVDAADSGQQGLEVLAEGGYDLVLLDYVMPEMDGLETLKRIRQMPEADDVLIVMLTAYASLESAVEAITLGAHDYIDRPADIDELRIKVRRAIETLMLRRENRYLRGELEKEFRFEELIAKSKRMMEVFRLIEQVADANTTVLIQGESGTGKELVARAIHARSLRNRKPMVTVNCPAIPSELFESEFFGHVKGAFTGALANRAGRFEEAYGGTLFLDEISEIPFELQSKLLRVLQEGEFERVGEDLTRQVDVRVIVATNRDLRQEITENRFRGDLYYRLNRFPIEMPPLRERKEDILPLIDHFLQKYNQDIKRHVKAVSPEGMELLLRYDYPGNVRELENIIERAVLRAEGDVITPRVLPPELRQTPRIEPASSWAAEAFADAKQRFEKEYLIALLEETRGNVSEAARRSGIERSNLNRKLMTHGINAKLFRGKS